MCIRDRIKGVYVPFWLFDAQVAANISYKGERTRTWSDAKYKYIEHNYYRIYRAGYVAFDQVPVDGSKKMADDLMAVSYTHLKILWKSISQNKSIGLSGVNL